MDKIKAIENLIIKWWKPYWIENPIVSCTFDIKWLFVWIQLYYDAVITTRYSINDLCSIESWLLEFIYWNEFRERVSDEDIFEKVWESKTKEYSLMDSYRKEECLFNDIKDFISSKVLRWK